MERLRALRESKQAEEEALARPAARRTAKEAAQTAAIEISSAVAQRCQRRGVQHADEPIAQAAVGITRIEITDPWPREAA